MLLQFKRSNPSFWCNGDDSHQDRERAQILILDRSFDPLSPLMHEYTYQAMAYDLLDIDNGVIEYKTATNKGTEENRKGLLSENDEIWLELRHSHIAKVIESIKDRMNDIIQNNAGANLGKGNGGDLDITTMAAAVKKLPEYTQTMTKLGQHVAIAQQCMNAFGKLGLLNLSQVSRVACSFSTAGDSFCLLLYRLSKRSPLASTRMAMKSRDQSCSRRFRRVCDLPCRRSRKFDSLPSTASPSAMFLAKTL